MRLFNKVAVIGTGLIGGSLGLAVKKHRLAREVVGVALHKESLNLALKMKAIDRGSLSLDIVKGADFLILAAPVGEIIKLAKQISRVAGRECLVTDVGSTKREIASLLQDSFPNYVGSHPLAGSEKRGIVNAQADIFENSLCILTPVEKTEARALARIKSFWARLGAKVALLTPEAHDRALAFTSHLPHIAAFSLINSVPFGFLKLSSGGLKDTTRIASSDPKLWQGIFLTNKADSLKAISLFEDNLRKIKTAIKRGDKKALGLILKQAQKKRSFLE